MPSSLLRRSLLSLAGLAATVTFGFFITLAYLFSAGDYVVQPGSPAYYVGISSVVRSLELPRGEEPGRAGTDDGHQMLAAMIDLQGWPPVRWD